MGLELNLVNLMDVLQKVTEVEYMRSPLGCSRTCNGENQVQLSYDRRMKEGYVDMAAR